MADELLRKVQDLFEGQIVSYDMLAAMGRAIRSGA